MPEKTPAPAISKEIVEYLERVFRDRCPELGTSPEQVWYEAGAVSVVRHLRKVYETQVHNVMR
jgi:hypothetical protein